jgi:aminopeptidase N
MALMSFQGLMVDTPDNYTIGIDAPTSAKKAVVTAVCRTLTQQWFGALVSLAWWDTLYLVRVFSLP